VIHFEDVQKTHFVFQYDRISGIVQKGTLTLLSVPSFFILGSAKSSFMPVLALGDCPGDSLLGTKSFSLHKSLHAPNQLLLYIIPPGGTYTT